MKKSTVIFALVLALLLACVPSAVYAMDNIGATDTVQPVASVIGQSVEAMNYSKAPDGLLPFIYSLAEEHTRLREELIGPCDCTPGWLYVKNMTTGNITLIYGAETLHYTATQDELYYVTANNTIMKTDFAGAFHTALYTASAPISELDYFEGKLYFLEDETTFIMFNVANGTIESIKLPEEASSAYMFASSKILWRDVEWNAYCYDMITKEHTELSNETEVVSLVMPYFTAENTAEASTASTTSLCPGPDIANDLSLPLTDYPATAHKICDGNIIRYYPTPTSYFTINGTACTDHGVSDIHKTGECNCKLYGASNQCDGFARYVHEKYIHVSGLSYGSLYTPANCSIVAEEFASETVKSYFDGLNTGAFIRFSNTTSGLGYHSAIFVTSDDNGVWLYECNMQDDCGVYLEYYDYDYIVTSRKCVVRTVNHIFNGTATKTSTTKHKIYCNSCSGYVYDTHNYAFRSISITQHEKYCTDCNYLSATSSHVMKNKKCASCGYTTPGFGDATIQSIKNEKKENNHE